MTSIGFVYIWKDRARKMFYIGSHFGRIDDGYICSSKNMLKQFRMRPFDFKRRIIEFCTKEQLLSREQYYLDLICDKELYYKQGRYYNVKRFAAGGDTLAGMSDEMRISIIRKRYGKKHSDSIKKAIDKRTPARKQLHQERRKISLHSTFSSSTYTNYQDSPFDVYVNDTYFQSFRNVLQFSKLLSINYTTSLLKMREGLWIVKHKRKHPFKPGDIISFRLKYSI